MKREAKLRDGQAREKMSTLKAIPSFGKRIPARQLWKNFEGT
ncbi:hypothetical protein DB41_HY00210 [Neochlamydia sp. TUME1]|nr:hypothetical protein DB41_HY00210 [Neochlamydia sp. TUME1]